MALNDVSLEIAKGEIYALVGPNGAGKSSLLNAVIGRKALTCGRVTICGAAAGTPAARRRLGAAPQRPALFDRLTAFENARCFARLAGVPARDAGARAAEALRLAGLDPESRQPAHRLSGGQRQRANIAAAMAHRPDLIVLDEPAAALDRDGVEGVNALIARLAAAGAGVLLVTHDMTQAEQLARRVGVLAQGRLLVEEAPERLKTRYLRGGLAVAIDVEDHGGLLSSWGFQRGEDGLWRGVAPDYEAVADLASRLAAAGGAIRTVDIQAPSLADAVRAALAAEPQPQQAAA